MDRQSFDREGKKFSERYLRELRDKWRNSQNEEAQQMYFKAVREYNKQLVMEGEI